MCVCVCVCVGQYVCVCVCVCAFVCVRVLESLHTHAHVCVHAYDAARALLGARKLCVGFAGRSKTQPRRCWTLENASQALLGA